MSYPLLVTLSAIEDMRGQRIAEAARYMYEKASQRDGVTGNDLLVVQFFYYHEAALPGDLPEPVRKALSELRCVKLVNAKSSWDAKDDNQRRYWFHIRTTCAGNPFYEYLQILGIEARIAGFTLAKIPGYNMSFIGSQLVDLAALKGASPRERVYAMLVDLTKRAGITQEQVNGRAYEYYLYYHKALPRIHHRNARARIPTSGQRPRHVPYNWFTEGEQYAAEHGARAENSISG